MNIQYCSDLHIEFPKNKSFIKENPIQPVGDVLVIAGDLVPFSVMEKHNDFFKFCADNFSETYWIPGNHEYYGFDITLKSGSFHEKIRSNVHLLNNKVIDFDELTLIFTTLWSKINPAHKWDVERGMNDFRVIKFGRYRLTADRFNNLHDENMQFLTKALTENKENSSIVVTHHVPTFQNYPPQYRGSTLNDAFGVELTDFIEEYAPNYWIYGHHHHNTPTFKIGNTSLMTNQLGYVHIGEHLDFRNDCVLKI